MIQGLNTCINQKSHRTLNIFFLNHIINSLVGRFWLIITLGISNRMCSNSSCKSKCIFITYCIISGGFQIWEIYLGYISQVLLVINSSANFYIYCIIGANNREQFNLKFCCKWININKRAINKKIRKYFWECQLSAQ